MAGERQRRTVLTAGFAGNVVEWYDFALYGFMASVFSRIFFPEGNELANLIAVYGIFAAGFVMRPLGSVVFGWLGDKVGRSRTMMISVALMAIPTFCLGLLPDYQAIGLAAPVMLVFLRLIQGLSVGGEFSTSVVYLVETAPDDRRGLSGSMANLGSVAGTAFGSLMAMGVLNLMPETDVDSWGWRIPYLLGGVIGIAAFGCGGGCRNPPRSSARKPNASPTRPSGKPFRQRCRSPSSQPCSPRATGCFSTSRWSIFRTGWTSMATCPSTRRCA
ncbi:MFS transporter [Roseovarius salis]|uniref:MFS transporter n=1 Tax=Roseovarius salis TaxID=3376063 RepID=UPI0037C8C910